MYIKEKRTSNLCRPNSFVDYRMVQY